MVKLPAGAMCGRLSAVPSNAAERCYADTRAACPPQSGAALLPRLRHKLKHSIRSAGSLHPSSEWPAVAPAQLPLPALHSAGNPTPSPTPSGQQAAVASCVRRHAGAQRARTLAHGPLHVAHDLAVLVVQELDAHLGDLREEEGRTASSTPQLFGHCTVTPCPARTARTGTQASSAAPGGSEAWQRRDAAASLRVKQRCQPALGAALAPDRGCQCGP
jgi:hypothetical protein